MILPIYIEEAKRLKKESLEVDAQISDANDIIKSCNIQLRNDDITQEETEELLRKISNMNAYIDDCGKYLIDKINVLKKRIKDRHSDMSQDEIISELKKHLYN